VTASSRASTLVFSGEFVRSKLAPAATLDVRVQPSEGEEPTTGTRVALLRPDEPSEELGVFGADVLDVGPLTMESAARIAGRVVSSNSIARASATVVLHGTARDRARFLVHDRNTTFEIQRTVSDGLGRYAFDDLPCGEWQVEASSDSNAGRRPPLLLEPGTDALREVVYMQLPAIPVAGRIVDGHGRPAGDVVVVLRQEVGAREITASGRTDERGEFSIAGTSCASGWLLAEREVRDAIHREIDARGAVQWQGAGDRPTIALRPIVRVRFLLSMSQSSHRRMRCT